MKPKWLLTGAAGFAVAVVCLFALCRSERPADVAIKVAECIEEADAACILTRMPQSEIDAYGLTEPKLKAFLTRYVLPSFAGMKTKSSGITISDDKGATYVKEFESKGGVPIAYGVQALRTADGIICPQIVGALMMSVFVARYSDVTDGSRVLDRVSVWLTASKMDRQELDKLGIHGVNRIPEEGLMKWNEWIAHCEKVIKQREETNRPI